LGCCVILGTPARPPAPPPRPPPRGGQDGNCSVFHSFHRPLVRNKV
jgi:hypothetical protein